MLPAIVLIMCPFSVQMTSTSASIAVRLTLNPAGIAVDEEGCTFIAEYYSSNSSYNYSRFAILDSNHTLVRHIQNFQRASDITIDKEGFIYVCGVDNYCVYKGVDTIIRVGGLSSNGAQSAQKFFTLSYPEP